MNKIEYDESIKQIRKTTSLQGDKDVKNIEEAQDIKEEKQFKQLLNFRTRIHFDRE